MDLLVHRITPKNSLKPHAAKQLRLTPDKEWQFWKIIDKRIDIGIYERIITANGCLSPWNAPAILKDKPHQDQLRLKFNYHYVCKKKSAS